MYRQTLYMQLWSHYLTRRALLLSVLSKPFRLQQVMPRAASQHLSSKKWPQTMPCQHQPRSFVSLMKSIFLVPAHLPRVVFLPSMNLKEMLRVRSTRSSLTLQTSVNGLFFRHEPHRLCSSISINSPCERRKVEFVKWTCLCSSFSHKNDLPQGAHRGRPFSYDPLGPRPWSALQKQSKSALSP